MMNNIRRKHLFHELVRICAAAFVLCIFCAPHAQARITRVGIPSYSTYVKKNDKKQVIIYVGDSRAMLMTAGPKKAAVRDNYAFAFVNGGNVTVIDKNGILTPYVEKLIKRYRKRNPVIVFNFGVNGNRNVRYNARRIIRIYRRWMKKYPDLRFVVESVKPTMMSSGSYSNKKVIKLNKKLKAEFKPDGVWMDTYDAMWKKKMIKKNRYGMMDDLHYKWSASRKLLKFIRGWINENIV